MRDHRETALWGDPPANPAGGSQTQQTRFAALTAFACLLALLPAVLLGPASASADTRFGENGTHAGQFSHIGGLAVSQATGGDLYVTDRENQRIDQFHPDGSFVRAFGWGVLDGAEELQVCTTSCDGYFSGSHGGSGPGELERSDEIAVDNDESSPAYGDVYVVDQHNYRVERFSSEGHFELMFGGGVDKGPHHPGNLCTTAYITEGDECGAGEPGTGPAHFDPSWSNEHSNSIAVGADGTVYVGDYARVQKFDPTGAFAGEITAPYAQLVGSLAVDASSRIYALFSPISEVQKITPPASGTYALTFKGATTSPLPSNATSGTLRSELEKLPTIGTDNVEVYSQEGSFVVAFSHGLRSAPLPQIEASAGSVETTVDGAGAKLAELGPSGEVLQSFDTEAGAEPTHVALDASGDVFVTDFTGGDFSFRAFEPDGALYSDFSSNQVGIVRGSSISPIGIAIDPTAGRLYWTNFEGGFEWVAVSPLPEEGPPTVAEEHVTDVEPTTATLHAVINPHKFDTHYHFEYISEAEYQANISAGHEPFQGAESTPSQDLGRLIRDDPVQAAISAGLHTGTVYRYRAVAESVRAGGEVVDGATEKFEALPAVGIHEFTTQLVGPEEVVLKANLSPDDSLAATTYEICYHEAASSVGSCTSGELHVPGNEFEEVFATFSGLSPNTEYRYQLTAENEYGLVEIADQTFTTEETVAEENGRAGCPNQTLREENGSLSLPDCRGYEQVSPAYKAGFPTTKAEWLSRNGERAMFESYGGFDGAVTSTPPIGTQYVAHRTPNGWVTSPVIANVGGPGSVPLGSFDFSPELDRWVFGVYPASTAQEAFAGNLRSGAYFMGLADGTYAKATPTIELLEGESRNPDYFMRVSGQSDDLSRLFIATSSRILPGDPRPDDNRGLHNRLYEVSGADSPTPTMRLVAEVPLGLSLEKGCVLDEPPAANEGEKAGRRVSADGSTVIYTAPIEEEAGALCGEGKPNPIGLFARTGEAAPVQLNLAAPGWCSAPAPCASAAPTSPHVYGVSPDGLRVWFSTKQPLVSGDKDSTEDLYLARLEGGQLTDLIQVSAGGPGDPTPGEGARLQGFVQSSEDGSHVAFVASGVLTTEPNASGDTAQSGADNLYLYDAESGETKFVADLCQGLEESGSLTDSQCPASIGTLNTSNAESDRFLWEIRRPYPGEARLTPDGRFLLFNTFGRLAPSDTDNVEDLYRYDFSTGRLIRISFGRNGNDGNGNDNAYPVELIQSPGLLSRLSEPYEFAEDWGRLISADGAKVIFKTVAPLVSKDTNRGAQPGCSNEQSGCDLYEWEEAGQGSCEEPEGCIGLISDGVNTHGIYGGTISSSGRDVTFYTDRGLVPDDTDGLGDVYDAREKGGFPPTPGPANCGNPETCQGPPGQPASSPLFTSQENHSGGNGPRHLNCGKRRHRIKRHGQVRCVPDHRKKHRHKQRGRAARRANTNRGGHK